MYNQETVESNDRTIVCIDCKSEFPFSASEQEFYREKQFQDPKRCRNCRLAKKNRNN